MPTQKNLFDLPASQKQSPEEILVSRLDHMSVTELASEIELHNRLYNEGNPVISDTLYDRLVERLRRLSPNAPVLNQLTSPAIESAADGKVFHQIPMLSLSKAYTVDEVMDFLAKYSADFIGSPKIDGLACSIRYDRNGDLLQASTRGDGQVGDDITANVRYIHAIPKHIEMPELEVRGEVYMPISSFNAFEGIKKSPRNLAVGGLKQKNPADTASYGLSFFAYEAVGKTFKTEHEKYDTLKSLGFTPVNYHWFKYPAGNAAEAVIQIRLQVEQYCQHETANRPIWDFDADGLVFKLDDTALQKSLGATDHHPRCAIAFKFAGDEGETVLKTVEWQVAKSGVITPVANFDPLLLSGAMVQRASLSNAAQIEKFPTSDGDDQHLKLGATLLVSRRGGVIPHVEKMISCPDHAVDVPLPAFCPSCGAPVIRDNLFLKCSDPDNCPSTGQALIENYLKVVNCLGFGEKIIANLYDGGLIKTPADLYRLSIQDIALAVVQSEDGTLDPDAVLPPKLYHAIQNTKELDLATFLESLSIPALGKVTSKLLAKNLPKLDLVLNANAQQLFEALEYRKLDSSEGQKLFQRIHDKTPKPGETLESYCKRAVTKKVEFQAYLQAHFETVESLLKATSDEIQQVLVHGYAGDAAIVRSISRGLIQRKPLIDDLMQYVTITEPQVQASKTTGAFNNMTFLFTGSLESMKREEAQARVEALGGKAASGVSKNLSVLVATSNTSSKWKKAQELNDKGASIQLWTESDFLAALDKAEHASSLET